MAIYGSFTEAKLKLTEMFLSQAYTVRAPRWQGIDVSNKPEMAMKEIFGHSILVPLRGEENLDYWRQDITPNLPWADEHFDERVGGQPLNPGNSWRNWPWGNSADRFRTENGGQFSHTYMERFWPKHAGGPSFFTEDDPRYAPGNDPRRGIRYEYGDLDDLVNHLADDPLSRQAYLPVWFPEDGTCKGRRPCTLGYHFLMRHDHLHVTYYIRSCDVVRHWADDCYLCVRLLLWVLGNLRSRNDGWKTVKPGLFTMHVASLHCFTNDWRKLGGKEKTPPVQA
jgi:hypothetical protein